MRKLHGPLRVFIGIWSAAIAVFYLYTAVFGIMQPRMQRGIHMLFLLPMGFLLYPATKRSPQDRPTLPDVLLAIASLAPALYVIVFNEPLNVRMLLVSPMETIQVVLGALNIVLILEATRRVVVPAMAVLVAAFIGYVWIAPLLPGIFYARPLKIARLVEINYLATDVGIYGAITGITATFVAVFVIFGSFMEGTKTGEFFTNFASKAAGRGPGGPAKIAVVSSGLFGSISGVAAANVYATGTFTIPLMKKLGYRSQFAGAVEAAASTGGLIMPPIMGAGAFVMSEITGIPYGRIALAAAIPAILYYVSIGVRVHFIALKDKLKPMDPKEMLSWKQIAKDSYLLIPLMLLIAMLVMGYSPFGACPVSIAATFVLSFLRKQTRLTPRKLFRVFENSGYNCIMLGVCCAAAGMVIAVVTYTGLALGIATAISSFSGGFLLPALILVMVTAILMGMGMPCTPAYIIAAVIGAPAMSALGIAALPAHLFVFYFAILAEVTPPVCIAAYCGAAIAGSKPLSTGWEASLLGIMGYVIPFIFVHNQAILLEGPLLGTIATSLLLLVVATMTASAITGFMFKHIGVLARIIMGALVAGLIILAAHESVMASLYPALAAIAVSSAWIVYFSVRNRAASKAFPAASYA